MDEDRRKEYFIKITPKFVAYKMWANWSDKEQTNFLNELKENLLQHYNFPCKVNIELSWEYYDT